MKELDVVREVIKDRFKGIDELESISYARGFFKGLAVSGIKGNSAKVIASAVIIEDKILEAGVTYMGLNIAESEESKKTS